MKARSEWWVLVATAGLAVLVAIAVWEASRPRPCRETFQQVRVGMTRAQVSATVGGPPGDYAGGENSWSMNSLGYSTYEGWLGPDAQLLVHFDDRGLADDVAIGAGMQLLQKPSVWERLCRRLGL